MLISKLVNKRLRGDFYETLAREHLTQAGLKHVYSNYYCRQGEIDLIMAETPGFLVFIEVKFRNSKQYGHVLEMVSVSKQRKIKAAARHFLLKTPKLSTLSCRFDVVGIQPADGATSHEIIWIPNAFV